MPTGDPICPVHGMTPCRCAEIKVTEFLKGTPEYSDQRASIYDLKGIAPDCTGKEDSVDFVRKLRDSAKPKENWYYHHPPTEPRGHFASECEARGCYGKSKKIPDGSEPWPAGYGVTMGKRYLSPEYGGFWTVCAADSGCNEVKLQSTVDNHLFWIGNAQEFQKAFYEQEGT